MKTVLNGKKIDVNVSSGRLEDLKGIVAVGIFEGEKLAGDLLALDKKLGNEISRLLKNKTITGKSKESQVISTLGRIKADRIIVMGMGEKKDFDAEKMRKASAIAAKYARSYGNGCAIAVYDNYTQAAVEGALLGLYRFLRYKKPEKGAKDITSLVFVNGKRADMERGIIISESVNYARDLTNTPAADMTPAKLADEAKKTASSSKLKIKIYGKNEIQKMGMNSFVAVAKGSSQEPRFIVIENKGRGRPIIIIGKGITFDSGGLDIKPYPYMQGMKGDKAGACAVIALMAAVSKLKIRQKVIGIIPACENMPSGSAYKTGDIIAALNKKTIEVISTDAEGRLILADALSYAERKYKPEAIIDLATLTGACIVALGYEAAAVMGNNKDLNKKIIKAGNECFERVWELPLWDEYKEKVKSDIADVRNVAKGRGSEAGTIEGAAFLDAFVEKAKWAHIDIAGVASMPEPREYIPDGATGYGVRLIAQLLSDW